MSTKNYRLAAACLAFLSISEAARSQVYTGGAHQSDGITVFGTAESRAKPNLVEIDLRNSATAELTDDAIVKYNDNKRRVLEAFKALEMDNLEIEEHDLSLTPGDSQEMMQAMMRGMPAPANTRMKVSISSLLRLRLTNIEDVPADELMKTIGRILDVAQDSGASVGPTAQEVQMAYRYGRYDAQSTMVKFVLRDFAELREGVYERAVADARARAARLARLHGVTLGNAVAVQEVQVTGDNPTTHTNQYGVVVPSPTTSDEPQISSDRLADIPFQVKLLVRFAIEDAAAATASR